jgi:hypothetical protein
MAGNLLGMEIPRTFVKPIETVQFPLQKGPQRRTKP